MRHRLNSPFSGTSPTDPSASRRTLFRNRLIFLFVAAALLVVFLLVKKKHSSSSSAAARSIEDTMEDPPEPTLPTRQQQQKIKKQNPSGNRRQQQDVAQSRRSGGGNSKQKKTSNEDFEFQSSVPDYVESGNADQMRAICEKALPPLLLRNALAHPVRYERDPNLNDEKAYNGAANMNNRLYRAGGDPHLRRPKSLIFIGDSHALRIFRWIGLMLYFGGHLRPESADMVGELFPANLDTGVTAEKPSLRLTLVPNAARLLFVQFRRAVFLEDAADAVSRLRQEMAHARRNADDVVDIAQKDQGREVDASRNRRNMDLLAYLSVGNWDLLRPEKKRHGYTLDSLFDGATAAPQQQNNNHNNAQKVSAAVDLSDALDKTLEQWRYNCGQLAGAIEEAIAKEDSSMKGSRVLWRWSGPPNCAAPRFHPPRAKPAMTHMCPVIADSYWTTYQAEVEKIVAPLAHNNFSSYFEFYEQAKKAPACTGKMDGVHPSHLCTAKEASSALLRALV